MHRLPQTPLTNHHIEEAVEDRLQAEVAVDTLLFHNGFYLMDLQNMTQQNVK
jgi:hypothetical protein